jgi:acyl-CoA thioester hydrolase
MKRRLAKLPEDAHLGRVARVRVLYADTDKMGVVYHGTYLRFMEHGRVELIRSTGLVYAEMEAEGYALPVTDVAVSYMAPARYDDVISIYAGVTFLSRTRVRFGYRLVVEPGGRAGLEESVTLLVAETWHCCLDVARGSPAPLPDNAHAALESA